MSIKLKGSTDGSVTLQAPADTSPTGTDKTFTLPTQDGDAGQILKTDGSGVLSFTDNLSSGRNRIINGDMRIDQRNDGASVTVNSGTSTFGVDRWKGQASGGGVYTQQRSSIAPAGFSNSTLLTVTTADSSIAASDYYIWGQAVEGFNAADFAWGTADAKTLTLSFWVRASVTGTYALFLGNNADNRSIVYTYTISAANTWEQKSIAISGDTSGTWATDNSIGIGLWFTLGAGSNFNATAGVWNSTLEMNTNGSANWIATNGATFYITGVQLEVGSVATPFERRNYGDELQKCKRYYQNAGSTHYGAVEGTDRFRLQIPLYPHMRAAPTCTVRTGKKFNTRYAGDTTITTPTIADLTSSPQNIWTGVTSSGLTAGTPIYGRSQQGADGDFLSVNAEL